MSGNSVFEHLINILAFTMESHLEAVAAAEGEVAKLDAGASNLKPLEDALERLRDVRTAIRERMLELRERLDAAPSGYLDDAYALIGYYIEAGARGEERLLNRASKYVDVSSDIEELEELVAAARILLAKLSERI